MEIRNKKNPKGDIEIIFTGLRPGEKLYEELLISDSVDSTQHQQIFKADEDFISWKELNEFLDLLKEASSNSDHKALRKIFKESVSGYKPEKEIIDVIYLETNKLPS